MTPATGVQSVAWLLVALPLVSSAVLLLLGRRADKWGHWLGALVPVALFVYAIVLFFSVKGQSDRQVDLTMFHWINVGRFHVNAGLLIDPLSLVFVLLITGVGSLIHIYAVGYMAHDDGRRRFFGYFNFFTAVMLLLVLANSYLGLYVGWEGVGVASYLLISYYYNRNSAATAGNKAFFANRVGDVGLSIAIMLMFAYLGSTSYATVLTAHLSAGVAAAISLMLLLGACGKSGQFPLQTWLPDAMEGPTPVSALIHAATMVTAGVYLIARSNVIFDDSQAARTVVTIIGAITLLYGCIAGAGQDDLKRVLANSTVSQIGYMFLAVGLGPGVYAIGIIHLLGHARHGRQDRHAALRGAAEGHADHVRRVPVRLPRDHRLPAVHRVLHQGQDHRGGLRQGRHERLDPRHHRAARRRADRLLHDPCARHDVPRPGALGSGRPPARGAEDHDDPDDRAGDRLARRRL